MVGLSGKPARRRGAWLEIDLAVAMGILVVTMMPLVYSFSLEARAFKASYYRAVAMEIVDGEMEILAGGDWRAFDSGTHEYSVSSDAARNLPAGKFMLTVDGKILRLDWVPALRDRGGVVTREVELP